MIRLPHWVITDRLPALYDHESGTAIEQTAKVYGAMNELIDEYNQFVDHMNETIEAFINDTNGDYEVFKVAIRQEFQDFIDVVDLKISSQDTIIANAVDYMKTNLKTNIRELISSMRVSGELNNDIFEVFNDIIDNVSNETTARETADSNLQKAIDDEVTTRETADSNLQKAIDDEVTTRETADNNLQKAIDDEVTAREKADNDLRATIEGVFDGTNKIGSASNPINQIFHKNAFSHKIGANDYTYIYVDIVNGNDDNDGLTNATPVKTLERGFYIATSISNEIRFNFMSAGTYEMKWYNITGLSIHFIPLVGEVTIKFNKHCAFYNCHLNFLGYAQKPLTVIRDETDIDPRFYLDGGTLAATYTDFQIKTVLNGAFGTFTACTIRHLIVTGSFVTLGNCFVGDEIDSNLPWIQGTNANIFLKSVKNALTKNRISYFVALNFGAMIISGSMSESEFICEAGSNVYYAHVTSTSLVALETLKNYGAVKYQNCISFFDIYGTETEGGEAV